MKKTIVTILLLSIISFVYFSLGINDIKNIGPMENGKNRFLGEVSSNDFESILNDSMIFIGGFKSSGTTLMRSILDVHPEVKCGPEMKITVETLKFMNEVKNEKVLIKFIHGSGVKDQNMEKAYGLFIYYLMLINVDKTKRLCNKEPQNILYISYFKRVFPNSKFIYVVRDGRESAYSLVDRTNQKVTFENFFANLKEWNTDNQIGYTQCLNAGPDYCKFVRYDQLVKNPKETIEDIATFLNLKWTDKFLHHEDFVEKDIRIAEKEWSLDKIKNEINTGSLKNWEGNVPGYDSELVSQKIGMLKVFKYL